jgi:hypothetical protein
MKNSVTGRIDGGNVTCSLSLDLLRHSGSLHKRLNSEEFKNRKVY